MADKNKRYYVYVISHEGKPLYVGKGTASRCMQHMQRDDLKHVDSLDIQVIYVSSEAAAFSSEAFLIEQFGLENLLNKQPGQGNAHECSVDQRRDLMEHISASARVVVFQAQKFRQEIHARARLRDTTSHYRQPDQSHDALRCIVELKNLRARILDTLQASDVRDRLHYVSVLTLLADELTRLRKLSRRDVEEVRWYEQDCISVWQQFKDCVRSSTIRKPAVVQELWAAVHGMFLTGPWGRGPTQWVRQRLDPRLRRMYYMLAKWVWPERHSRISRYQPYDYRWDFGM